MVVSREPNFGSCRYLPGFTGFADPSPSPDSAQKSLVFNGIPEGNGCNCMILRGLTCRFLTALGLRAVATRFTSPLASCGIRLIGVGLPAEAAHVIIVRQWVVIICKSGMDF